MYFVFFYDLVSLGVLFTSEIPLAIQNQQYNENIVQTWTGTITYNIHEIVDNNSNNVVGVNYELFVT